VNERRKDLACQYSDRIRLGLVTDSLEVRTAIEENREYVRQETLAVEIEFGPLANVEPLEATVADAIVLIYIAVVDDAER
jgi:hypothetical protein